MSANNLPETDDPGKTLAQLHRQLMVSLAWIEELAETALVALGFALLMIGSILWQPVLHILAWQLLVVYGAYRIGNALMGNDRWSELRRARR